MTKPSGDAVDRVALIREAVERRASGVCKKHTGMVAFECAHCGADEIEKRTKRMRVMVCHRCRKADAEAAWFAWGSGDEGVREEKFTEEKFVAISTGRVDTAPPSEAPAGKMESLSELGRALMRAGVCSLDRRMCRRDEKTLNAMALLVINHPYWKNPQNWVRIGLWAGPGPVNEDSLVVSMTEAK